MPPSIQIVPPALVVNNNNNKASFGQDRQDSDVMGFYRGANVLLTGATGFMGKVLLEKLLRSCPEVGTIYTLIRTKKGQSTEKRAESMFDNPLFARLQEENPKFRHHIVALAGDCSLPGLGLSPEARATLVENVNVIFHCAATVRFDEVLDLAVNINVRGTKCVVDLAKECKNLKVMMHVSTAYCNCTRQEIDEVLYDVPIDCDRVVQLVNAADSRVLERITPTLIDKWPNSYAFTKAVGENVIKLHRGNLPIGVFRPAIVVNSAYEPVPGWIDNLYGPGGVVLAAGSGLMHTLHAGKDRVADLVPVDMAVNALLASAWETATMTPEDRALQPDGVPVYNYVSSVDNRLDWRTFMRLTSKHGVKVPTTQAIWLYSLVLCDWRITHLFLTALLHFLPALFVDAVCIVTGSPFRLVKVYKKIVKFSDVIAYFATNEWHFHNSHVRSLWLRLSDKEKALFPFDMKKLNWDEFFLNYILGMRLYMFKEPISNLPQALAKQKKLWWAHNGLIAVVTLLLLRAGWAMLTALSGCLAAGTEAPGLGLGHSSLGAPAALAAAVQGS